MSKYQRDLDKILDSILGEMDAVMAQANKKTVKKSPIVELEVAGITIRTDVENVEQVLLKLKQFGDKL